MFIGHFGVGFGAKAAEPNRPSCGRETISLKYKKQFHLTGFIIGDIC